MNMHRGYIFLLILALFMLPVCATAAGSATVLANGNRTQVHWADGVLRLDPGNRAGYLLIRSGHVYAVRPINGRTRVVDMTGMLNMARNWSLGGQGSLMPLDHTVVSVEKTAQTAMVAGIKGRVYTMITADKQGNTQTRRLVLTDNPVVVEMTAAYLHALSAILGQKRLAHLMQQFPPQRRGLLQAGTSYQLASIAATAPDPELFTLPRKPQGFTDLLQQMLELRVQ